LIGSNGKSHTAVKVNAMFRQFIVWRFNFKYDLRSLLREEVEEDGFAETLSAEFGVDSEMFDIDHVGEVPVGEYAHGLVEFVAAVGCHHEVEEVVVAVAERGEIGSFGDGESRLEEFACKMSVGGFCKGYEG